ncbi:MAG: asparagine synthase, partial [Nocardioidaceae bacterium]
MIVSSGRWDDLASWFVVLPDCPAALPVAARLRGLATNALVHPSGRPWILGRWGADVVSTGSAGSVAVAVLGQHAVTSGELEAAAEPTGSVADLDRLSRSMVGSAHLVGSVGGMVRVQGSVTGLRRVVHARVDGVAVASDRADVLASLAGAELEPERLAVYLLTTTALHPLAGRPVWRGLEVLPGDRYLVLDGEGREGL